MNIIYKFCGIFIFVIFSTKQVFSQDSGTNWPENKTSFPYPTPGPINIITSLARNLTALTPLKFNSDPLQTSVATNTGKSLLISSTNAKNEKAVISGGILYNETYVFFQTEYFWDLRLKPDAAVKINGAGSPVQVVVSYYNKKYGSKEKAMVKPDGIAQIVLFVFVGLHPNENFYPFQLALQPLKNAGSSRVISQLQSYSWYFQNSAVDDYYAYPSRYVDQRTGEGYYSSTVIVLVREPQASISFIQFLSTFASFRNKAKKPYSNIARIVPTGERPTVHGNGLIKGK